jgi:hypothetical protein
MLRWLTAPRQRSFVAFLLLAGLVGIMAAFYTGRLNQRKLAQVVNQAQHLFVDPAEQNRWQGERAALEYQRANLAGLGPPFTNAATAQAWTEAVATATLHGKTRQALRAWQHCANPLVLAQAPELETVVALQEAYETAVDRIVNESRAIPPLAALAPLRTNTFRTLFEHPVYLADQEKYDRLAFNITDADAVATRSNYLHTLAMRVPAINPALQGPAEELRRRTAEWASLQTRLQEYDRRLGAAAAAAAPDPGGSFGGGSWGRQLRAVCAPQEKDYLVIEGAAAVLLLLLTLPQELRAGRWKKIGLSLVLIYLGLLALRVPLSMALAEKGENVFAFFGFVLPMVLVAAIWTGDVAWYLAHGFTTLVDSAGPAESESASLRPALVAARQGDYREALRRLRLANRSNDYEALLLRARLHRRLNRKWRTKLALKELLRRPELHPSQRGVVENLLRHMDDPSHPGWDIS